MNKTQRYSRLAIYCALAIVINLVENMFLPPLYFGIRFGLANIVSIVSLKKMGLKDMCIVVFLRLTLGNLLKGTIFGTPFIISSLGLLLSSIIIVILDKLNSSVLFTSMISSVFHTLGQLIAVCFIYSSVNMVVILPVLVISSLATGILTGYISTYLLKRIK